MPPAQQAFLRLAASVAASVLFHAALAASLEPLIGGGTAEPASHAAPLRATLVAVDGDPRAPAAAVSRPPRSGPRSGPGQGASPAAASAPLPGVRYLTAAELDQRPAPASNIDPDYPVEALPASGTLVVRVLINEQGGADGVQVLAADPPGVFERAVTKAFGEGRYRPGMKGGKAVKSQFTVEVTFHPERSAGAAAPAPARPN